jgi:hypothetical protein
MQIDENIAFRNAGTVKCLGETKRGGYALFIALIPVLMMYKLPVVKVGLSTGLVAAIMPYAAFKAISANKRGIFKIIFPMVLYCGYVIARSDGNITNMLLTVAVVAHLLATASGAVRLSYARKVIETVSTLAAVGVIVQSVVYYLFHLHLPMIVANWVLDAMQDSYRMFIATGISRNEILYRPSAFFLEPAHLAQYTIVALISCLFRTRPKYYIAAVISLGTLLSTSGMGMVLTVFAWGVHALRLLREFKMKKGLSRFLSVVVVALIAAALLSQLGIVQSAFARFSGGLLGSTSEYNAVLGRTLYWKVYITPLSGNSLLWGMGFAALPDVYFTGLMEILFCYGLVGVGLFYLTVIGIIIKTSGFGRCVAIAVGGLMPIANLSSFLSFIYFFGMLYAFWCQQKRAAPTNRRILGHGRRVLLYRGRLRNGL